MTAQIDGYQTMIGLKILHLRRHIAVVATPAMNQQQWRFATTRFEICQLDFIAR